MNSSKIPILILAIALGLLLSYFAIDKPLKPDDIIKLSNPPLIDILTEEEPGTELLNDEVSKEDINIYLDESKLNEKNIYPLTQKDFTTSVFTYSTDGKTIFSDREITNIDFATAEVLKGKLETMKGYREYVYIRDKDGVYYKGSKLHKANPATFTPIENGEGSHSYGTDGLNVYYEDRLLQNTDPKTFEILWYKIYEGCPKEMYSKDSAHVYFKSSIVFGADPATFEALIMGFGKDKNGYYNGNIHVGPFLDKEKMFCPMG